VKLHSLSEGLGIALDQLRANKLRSALTMLGVVIGVATVMAMASIVQGIRDQIINTIEVAGPTTFYVVRFFSQTPLNPDALPKEVRIRPVIKPAEAEAIASLPQIRYAGTWVQLFQKMEYQGERTQIMTEFGADSHYMDIQGGQLLRGRFFTEAEENGGAPSWCSRRSRRTACSGGSTRSIDTCGSRATRCA
jgi:putative ABC transport system permease protein